MKWYDFFSFFYDNSLEKLYFESRRRAAELLDIQPGQTVFDVACGTGANLKHIKSADIDATIYATDFSTGMLEKARSNVEKNNWRNIHLFQADARALNQAFIEKQFSTPPKFEKIICFLGLSVIPEWEKVLDNLLEILAEDGEIVIADVFAEKRTVSTWLVEKVAKADLNRKIRQMLESKTKDFYYEYMPIKESKVGGKLFIAKGKRKR